MFAGENRIFLAENSGFSTWETRAKFRVIKIDRVKSVDCASRFRNRTDQSSTNIRHCSRKQFEEHCRAVFTSAWFINRTLGIPNVITSYKIN
jgi:hypothetical protein